MPEDEEERQIINRISALLQAERWSEVLACVDELRLAGVSGPLITLAEAMGALGGEDYVRAENLIQRLRAAIPEEEHPDIMLYRLLEATGREAELIALAERNVERFPASAIHAQQVAHAAFRAHDLAKARYFLNEALMIDPSDARMRQMRLLLVGVGKGPFDDVALQIQRDEGDIGATLARLVREGDVDGFAQAYRRYAPDRLMLDDVAERIIARATIPGYRLLERVIDWLKVDRSDADPPKENCFKMYAVFASCSLLLVGIGERNQRFDSPWLELLYLVLAVGFLPMVAAGMRFSVTAAGRYGSILYESKSYRLGPSGNQIRLQID